jgi:hypothetical protein
VRSFYTDTVTRLRPQLVSDAHNPDPEPDWTVEPVEVDLTGCRFQPISSTEELNLRDGVEVNARLLGPVSIDLAKSDRIRFDGDTFEVVGEPLAMRGPYGNTAHSETMLRRFDG